MTPNPAPALSFRPATPRDAAGVANILAALTRAGLRRTPSDRGFALHHYIAHEARIQCTLASDTCGQVLGFQSLKLALPGNPYDTPESWGIIGTHIAPSATRRGLGRRLFAETLRAARDGKLGVFSLHQSSARQHCLYDVAAVGDLCGEHLRLCRTGHEF